MRAAGGARWGALVSERVRGVLGVMAGRSGVVDVVVFVFQAEDGIRDVAVTGVQTCALPIYMKLNRRLTVFWSLFAVSLLFSFMFLPHSFQVLWPMATLLLGVACGTAAFAQEQIGRASCRERV